MWVWIFTGFAFLVAFAGIAVSLYCNWKVQRILEGDDE